MNRIRLGTGRWGPRRRKGGLVGCFFDWAWRITALWSITVDGEITWWVSDDIHHRERKIDAQIRVPRILWRPYCWWMGGHDWYYRYCIFCETPFSVDKPTAPRQH